MIIGITGKIASGKSTYAQTYFQKEEIYEVDFIGHDLLKKKEIQSRIIAALSLDISIDSLQNTDTKILKKHITERIIKSEKNLSLLEDILHPPMKKRIQDKINHSRNTKKTLIIICALPNTFRLPLLCDKIITLQSTKKIAYERCQVRNPQYSRELFEILWQRQEKEDKKNEEK